MSGKLLDEYTTAEVKAICVAHPLCKGCPFVETKGLNCRFSGCPGGWGLPSITEPERELLRLTGAKFISRNNSDSQYNIEVILWNDRPVMWEEGKKKGKIEWFNGAGTPIVGRLSATLFPSVLPGMCLDVAALLKKGEADHG